MWRCHLKNKLFNRIFNFNCSIVLIVLFLGIIEESKADSNSWNVILDFMIQDVCIGSDKKVLVGISPLEDAGSCKQHRNLFFGESLSYHKHDWPNDKQILPQGYQRSDSFPFNSKVLGTLAIQTFDFGNGDLAFGGFDDEQDGGQVVAFSRETASIIMTEDSGRGIMLMAGQKCNIGSLSPYLLLDSWVVVDNRAENIGIGDIEAKLRIVLGTSCPNAFDLSYTEWHFANYRYRSSIYGDLSKPLFTLVSSHYGGNSVSSAAHLERFYFTRELGWVRWERWQNMKYSKDSDLHLKRAQEINKSKRCFDLESAPSDEWVMLDCREWSNIIASDRVEGDMPDFWIDKLKNSLLTQSIFQNN